MKQEIYWNKGQPMQNIKEPVLIKLNGAFKWGLAYKVPESDEDPQKVWRLSKDVIEWAEIA